MTWSSLLPWDVSGDEHTCHRYYAALAFWRTVVFKHVDIKPSLLATFVVAFLPDETYTLSIDRTNGMLGCFPINFLVLSVVHEGMAFPILWLLLPKKGNSNTTERIELLEKFIHIFGVDTIDRLLGDREFIGETWFAY
jgi:hypothetical protein